ncbi:MAG: carbamoyl transferase, partial [Parcubacteria group bacterium SW_6_46_9]
KNQEEKFLPYLGPTYDLSKESLQDRNYFQDALIEHDLSFKSIDNPAEKASRMIAGGSVVAWFQGRSEYGPRALGNRSILADPRSADNKAKCHSVKEHREPHRPFSPSVIYSQAQNFFAVERETPYMITVSDVLPDKKEEIPAVVHADGTSRLQTVTKKDNARFYALLQEFYANTGIPLVLNTSFNLSGDPIVESPEDALRTFLRSTLDALFVGDVIIKRK